MTQRWIQRTTPDAGAAKEIPWATTDDECPLCGGSGLRLSIHYLEQTAERSAPFRARRKNPTDLPPMGVVICSCVDVEMRPVTWR